MIVKSIGASSREKKVDNTSCSKQDFIYCRFRMELATSHSMDRAFVNSAIQTHNHSLQSTPCILTPVYSTVFSLKVNYTQS